LRAKVGIFYFKYSFCRSLVSAARGGRTIRPSLPSANYARAIAYMLSYAFFTQGDNIMNSMNGV